MPDEPQQIVQKLWNYCHILRDEGLSCHDYLEQLTYLLFLKMADERTRPPFNQKSIIPKGHDWRSLIDKEGDALRGWEIVDATARLCAMNLYSHGIGGDDCPIRVDDSLKAHPGAFFDVKRDKASLDIFWLKDQSLEDAANFPEPEVIAAEIVEDLQSALEAFSDIARDLASRGGKRE